MFTHLAAGAVIFLLMNWLRGIENSHYHVLMGGFLGHLPDLLSFCIRRNIKISKTSHHHRDVFTHTLYLPLISTLLVLWFWGAGPSITVGLILLSHLFLDSFGIGWGIKLLPFSGRVLKLFYRPGQVLFTAQEMDSEAAKNGRDDWLRSTLWGWNWTCAGEWFSLLFFLWLVVYV